MSPFIIIFDSQIICRVICGSTLSVKMQKLLQCTADLHYEKWKKVDLFDACAVVVLNDSSLPSSCDHRCVVIRVACKGQLGRLGPSTLDTGIEWITESPRAVFKGLIGLGAATTTLVLFFHFASPSGIMLPPQTNRHITCRHGPWSPLSIPAPLHDG